MFTDLLHIDLCWRSYAFVIQTQPTHARCRLIFSPTMNRTLAARY